MPHETDMRLQEEMEPEFHALADWWQSRGHSAGDVAVALLGLAMARVEAQIANLETEEAIRRAKATIGRA